MSDPAEQRLDELIAEAIDIIWKVSKDEEAFAWGIIAFQGKFALRSFDSRFDVEKMK